MNRIDQAHYPVTAHTDPGKSGKINEDRYGVSAFKLDGRKPKPVLLAVLCDGIGGHRAGEVAAEMAVNTISDRIAASSGKYPVQTLRQAVQEASDQIVRAARADPSQYGMGATCACALLIGDQLYTASVGDSRIYLIRDQKIQQLTFDHTWIQEALEYGLITPDQVAGHPNAHVIRRYLGSPSPPEVDFRIRMTGAESNQQAAENQGTKLLPQDYLLLCSDGLTDLVSDQEILQVFQQNPLQEVGQILIDLANERGGHDNITLIALEISKPEKPHPPALKWPGALLGGLGLIAAGILTAAIIFGWLWFQNQPVTDPTSIPSPDVLVTQAPTDLPSPEIFPSQPGSTPQSTPQPAQTAAPFSEFEDGATLTPWPTNTNPPSNN